MERERGPSSLRSEVSTSRDIQKKWTDIPRRDEQRRAKKKKENRGLDENVDGENE